MNIDLDNPRIKVKNSKTEKQCCIVCDQFIATKDEEGNVEATKILSISNNPGSGKIAFSKNLHIHIGCVEAFANNCYSRPHMRIKTKSSHGTRWMRTLDTIYPMDKHTLDMIDALGQKMAEQLKTRPKHEWEDVMNIFVMTESARLMGSHITTTPEESWQLAVNTFEQNSVLTTAQYRPINQ